MADKGSKLKTLSCSFCGRSEERPYRIIQGHNVAICDQCIFESVELIKADVDGGDIEKQFRMPVPVEIKNELDEYVIGQDNAKKAISISSIYMIPFCAF